MVEIVIKNHVFFNSKSKSEWRRGFRKVTSPVSESIRSTSKSELSESVPGTKIFSVRKKNFTTSILKEMSTKIKKIRCDFGHRDFGQGSIKKIVLKSGSVSESSEMPWSTNFTSAASLMLVTGLSAVKNAAISIFCKNFIVLIELKSV